MFGRRAQYTNIITNIIIVPDIPPDYRTRANRGTSVRPNSRTHNRAVNAAADSKADHGTNVHPNSRTHNRAINAAADSKAHLTRANLGTDNHGTDAKPKRCTDNLAAYAAADSNTDDDTHSFADKKTHAFTYKETYSFANFAPNINETNSDPHDVAHQNPHCALS
jgi:hypothetical protein